LKKAVSAWVSLQLPDPRRRRRGGAGDAERHLADGLRMQRAQRQGAKRFAAEGARVYATSRRAVDSAPTASRARAKVASAPSAPMPEALRISSRSSQGSRGPCHHDADRRRTAQTPEAKPLVEGNEPLDAARATTARRLQRDLARVPIGRANELTHDGAARALPSLGRLYPLQVPPRDAVRVTDAMNFQIDMQALRQLNAIAQLGNSHFWWQSIVGLAHLHCHRLGLHTRHSIPTLVSLSRLPGFLSWSREAICRYGRSNHRPRRNGAAGKGIGLYLRRRSSDDRRPAGCGRQRHWARHQEEARALFLKLKQSDRRAALAMLED